MMDFCSRLYRVTTSETDLYLGKGYKYASDTAALKKVMAKFQVQNVEVKVSSLDGSRAYYTSMSAVDLATTLGAEN